MSSLVMFIIYNPSLVLFLDGGNTPLFGLSLLIDQINGDNASNGLCAFGVLHAKSFFFAP